MVAALNCSMNSRSIIRYHATQQYSNGTESGYKRLLTNLTMGEYYHISIAACNIVGCGIISFQRSSLDRWGNSCVSISILSSCRNIWNNYELELSNSTDVGLIARTAAVNLRAVGAAKTHFVFEICRCWTDARNLFSKNKLEGSFSAASKPMFAKNARKI